MFCLETDSVNPYYNLAFEETVFLRRRLGDYLILWQNEPTVVVGQNQNTAAEINQAFVSEHHIHIVRRSTGGGAVYHDLGNLNYSFISDAGNQENFSRFTRSVVEALNGLGMHAEASGRNDILVDGHKISGTARRIVRGRILHHGTLLFNSDLSMAAGALKTDPEKFASKGVKSVRSRIGNIRDFLPYSMTLAEFRQYLKQALSGGTWENSSQDEREYEKLSEPEYEEIRTLQRTKYETWEWNYGRSPAYNFRNRRRWNGGSLEIRIQAEHGKITNITFYGDFLSTASLVPLTEALQGCPFEKSEIAAVLRQFSLPEYFGTISENEILDTFFP